MNAPPKLDGSDTAPPVDGRVPTQARVLRRLFLTLFLRGRTSRGLQRSGAPGSIGRKLFLTILIYALFGCVCATFAGRPVFSLSLYLHAITLMFLGMFVAASAGEVLFNREEGDILLHRPVSPRTLLWAKVSVLVEVSLWLATALNLATFVVGCFAPDSGWRFLPVHAVSVVLEALFCSGSVVLAYQLCLRWFGRERLEGLMTTAQVLLAVVAVAGGQVVPQLLMHQGRHVRLTSDHFWMALLPPAWFAGFDDAMAGSGSVSSWALGVLALLSTGGVLWLAFARLSSQYGSGLMALAEAKTPAPQRGGRRWLHQLVQIPPVSWWLRNPVERASFLLTAAYLLRDRDMKLRLYPALAPMVIMPVIFLMRDTGEGGGAFGVAFAGSYLALLPLLSLELIEYSQHWQASDIFRAAPVSGPAPFCNGSRRAVLLLLTVPAILGATLITGVLTRDPARLVLLLPGILALPVYAMIPCVRGRAVPLCRPTEEAKSARRALTPIVVMLLAGLLSGLASWAWSGGWLGQFLSLELAVALLAYLLLRSFASRARWAPME
ncbi:MAG: hypothetical protein U1G08_04040 [Verrucomicrobiota bacterium]